MLWGAAWLYRATNDASYMSFINSLGANDDTDIFSWDNKYAGARVLLSRVGKKKKSPVWFKVKYFNKLKRNSIPS